MTDILAERRASRKQSLASANAHIWAAILDVDAKLKKAGLDGLEDIHIQQAKDNLLLAGELSPDNMTNEELRELAAATEARNWKPDMGWIYRNETTTCDNVVYLCLTPHVAQQLYKPGTDGGRSLFRVIRDEPQEGYLDFVWGEFVPYGAIRRDPTDGNIYTPVKETGVILYEPHYPSQVASEYHLHQSEPEQPGDEVTKWVDLPENHIFNPGDRFSDYGVVYEVARLFQKLDHHRPPALINDFYFKVTV